MRTRSLSDVLRSLHLSTVIISIAAGIRLKDLSRWLGGYRRIARSMPNTPALIGMGATGLIALPEVDETGRALASSVLDAVGITVWLEDEAAIDAVTAIFADGRIVVVPTAGIRMERPHRVLALHL
jgi:pyrroline-5-carboxylate reductase